MREKSQCTLQHCFQNWWGERFRYLENSSTNHFILSMYFNDAPNSLWYFELVWNSGVDIPWDLHIIECMAADYLGSCVTRPAADMVLITFPTAVWRNEIPLKAKLAWHMKRCIYRDIHFWRDRQCLRISSANNLLLRLITQPSFRHFRSTSSSRLINLPSLSIRALFQYKYRIFQA